MLKFYWRINSEGSLKEASTLVNLSGLVWAFWPWHYLLHWKPMSIRLVCVKKTPSFYRELGANYVICSFHCGYRQTNVPSLIVWILICGYGHCFDGRLPKSIWEFRKSITVLIMRIQLLFLAFILFFI